MPDDEGHVPESQAMAVNRAMVEFHQWMDASSESIDECQGSVRSALDSMHHAILFLADAVKGCPTCVLTPDSAVFDTPTDKIEPHHAPHDANRKAY